MIPVVREGSWDGLGGEDFSRRMDLIWLDFEFRSIGEFCCECAVAYGWYRCGKEENRWSVVTVGRADVCVVGGVIWYSRVVMVVSRRREMERKRERLRLPF